jgi:ABC-2 type transport system ATP-binding protein
VVVTAENAVCVRGLTKIYGNRRAVDDLAFTLPVGSLSGFIGPNGAGKTTTLRVLLGLVQPSAGEASVLGEPIARPDRYLGRVGALIEGPAFYPALSGRRNLEVLARLGGLPPDHSIDAVLNRVDLVARAADPYRSYSLGMKQRLGIAAALLRRPELVVLDEPMNGLDPAGMREIRGMLSALADTGVTVLVSSHLLDEVQQISRHLVVIREGHLIYEGSVTDLLAQRRPRLVARPESPSDVPRLAELCTRAGYPAVAVGWPEPSGDGRQPAEIHVEAPADWAGELNRRAMAEGVTLVRLTTAETRLEDAFLDLTETTGTSA